MWVLRKITRIFEHTNNLLAFIAGVIIIFTMAAVTYEVVMRYFLNRPTLWVVEVSGYSLLFITFLGAAWVLRRGGHVRIDLLINRLKPRNQVRLSIITSIMAAIICLVIAWYSGRVTWISFQTDYLSPTELRFPLFIILFIIPVGSFLLFIQFLIRISGLLGQLRASPNKD